MMKKIAVFLATGFGLGYSPVASGTLGTFPGFLPAIAICFLPAVLQGAAAILCAAVAVPLCDIAENYFGRKDDGRIVADEYLTLPLCIVGLPAIAHPWLFALAFFTHRLCDVIKPPPARQIQSLKGGLGIVMDDFISGLYALALNHLVWWIVSR